MKPGFPYTFSDALSADRTVLTAWSSVADTGFVAALADQGFDAVTLDMQHGGHHEQSVMDGTDAVVRRGRVCAVRIPVGRNDFAARALDFGADAVIAPMINTVDDARAFAAAVKYPPVGGRSWGPSRAIALRGVAGGNHFLHSANAQTVAFAMIETREALAVVDDILAVDGIDGVFVGPADFSIAWTGGETLNPQLQDMMGAIGQIAAKAKACGKHAGIFAMNPADTPKYKAMGYRFIAVGFDTGVVAKGAQAILAVANGSADDAEIKGGY